MKKLALISALLFLAIAWTSGVYSATQDDFTLTILKDGAPVREFSEEVAIPFDTEYKLRLKNDNHRRCSATVWIDGAKVSEIGNFIIDPTDYLDLERFLNESLTEGKRFKFVPLNHPNIDDPNRAENGIVKVEFRLERLQEIMPKKWYWERGGLLILDGNRTIISKDEFLNGFTTDTINTIDFNHDLLIGTDSTSILCSTTSAGATVPGSHSNQSFYKVDFDGEDEVVTIQLKMVGIKRGLMSKILISQ